MAANMPSGVLRSGKPSSSSLASSRCFSWSTLCRCNLFRFIRTLPHCVSTMSLKPSKLPGSVARHSSVSLSSAGSTASRSDFFSSLLTGVPPTWTYSLRTFSNSATPSSTFSSDAMGLR